MSRGASGLLDIEISTLGIEDAIRDLEGTLPQVEKALASTMRKMALWLRSQSIKGLSSTLKVQQKIVRRRLRTFRMARTKDKQSITVWYGLNPIAYIYLGTPRKTSTGVRVGQYSIPGAFIARGKGGNLQIFKREGKARLPIAKQALDVQEPAETFIEDKLLGTSAFEIQFFKLFEHELQWQTRTRA